MGLLGSYFWMTQVPFSSPLTLHYKSYPTEGAAQHISAHPSWFLLVGLSPPTPTHSHPHHPQTRLCFPKALGPPFPLTAAATLYPSYGPPPMLQAGQHSIKFRHIFSGAEIYQSFWMLKSTPLKHLNKGEKHFGYCFLSVKEQQSLSVHICLGSKEVLWLAAFILQERWNRNDQNACVKTTGVVQRKQSTVNGNIL